MRLENLNNGWIIATDIRCADTFLKRLRGLMFTDFLPSGSALHIKPCRSVHTFFMRYDIDILYLSEQNEIVAIDHAMKPGKVGKVYRKAVSVVELPAGMANVSETKVGHQLHFN